MRRFWTASTHEPRQAVDLATEEAKAGPEPRLELASTNVWSDGSSGWRN